MTFDPANVETVTVDTYRTFVGPDAIPNNDVDPTVAGVIGA